MRALVTGAAGFIGSTLAERLVRDGHEVIGVDSFSGYYGRRYKESNLSSLIASGAFSLLELDLVDADLSPVLEGVDTIFHQAGQPGVRTSWGADFASHSSSNIIATQRLLEAACQLAPHLKRFVHASSSSVYGRAERYPAHESDRLRPHSPYGVTKLAAEHLVSTYSTHFGLPAICLRYFTVYGPRQRPDMAFSRFIMHALQDQPVCVYGDGSQVREFTFVDDIVEGNVLASAAPLEPGMVINLAGGTVASISDVLHRLETIHGRPIKVIRGQPAPGDVARTGGSIDRARDLLAWQPRVTLEDGLALQYRWHVDSGPDRLRSKSGRPQDGRILERHG